MPELCYREIGKFLGLSSSTVGITIRACLEKLKGNSECADIKDMILQIGKSTSSTPECEQALKDSDNFDIEE